MIKITLKKLIQGRKYPRPFSFLSTKDKYIDKTYEIPFFRGVALRKCKEIGDLTEKAKSGEAFTSEEFDKCVEWFCLLFDNKFTTDDLLNGYPSDQLMPDIFAAYFAMQAGVLRAFTEFPIPPTATAEQTA